MQDAASTPDDPGPSESRVLEWARTELGPASERLLRRPEILAGAVADLGAGRNLADATLACVYRHVAGQRQLADEFAAYFLFDLMRMGKSSMSTSSKLRRFLDTGDLVLSVFGDLWTDFSDIDFESSSQFKALFAKRINWKAIDQSRRLNSGRRREDQRVAELPEDLDLSEEDTRSAPLPQAIRSEERDRFILILLRLDARDRELLTQRLRGTPIDVVAQSLGMTVEAARRATDRAILKARRLASGGDDPAGTGATC